MSVHLDFENASACKAPAKSAFRQWVAAALDTRRDKAELSLRIVDSDEMRDLNNRYRGADYATNVLSFPADLPPELQSPHLGDIVICAAVVEREAEEQHKISTAHWAHMVIHGTLHLLGYDHIDNNDAEIMEAIEIDILSTLGIANPYDSEDDSVNHV